MMKFFMKAKLWVALALAAILAAPSQSFALANADVVEGIGGISTNVVDTIVACIPVALIVGGVILCVRWGMKLLGFK